MIKNKKIFYVLGFVTFSCASSFAMEKIQSIIPDAKIYSAATATFLGGKIIHNLVTAHISPDFYHNSKFIIPLAKIYECVRYNPVLSSFPIVFIALAARAGSIGPKLEAAQLIKPLAYALGGIALMSSYNGIKRYMSCRFNQEILDAKNSIYTPQKDIARIMKKLGKASYKKFTAVYASSKTFQDFYLLSGLLLSAYILYKRYSLN